MQSDVEQIVPLILARAGLEKRLIETGRAGEDGPKYLRFCVLITFVLTAEDAFATLITVLESGIEMVHRGDRHIYRNVESRNAEIIMSSVSNRGSSTPN